MVLGKLDSCTQKNETTTISHHTKKVNWIWLKELNSRPKTIKLLEDNIGGKTLAISLGNDFFGSDNKSKGNKKKNKQVGLPQTIIKSFLTWKEAINKIKRQPTEWEKIFSNQICDKELQKYIKNSYNSTGKTKRQSDF